MKTPEGRQSNRGGPKSGESPDFSTDNCKSTAIRPREQGEPMANHLDRDKQIQVLRLLSEGNSIRSVVRLTGIHKSTILRIVVRFGNQCRDYLDHALVNLNLSHVQLDEIWTFCGMKEGRAKKRRLDTARIGDQYLYTALDTETKLLVSFALGKRNWEATNGFIADLRKRLVTPAGFGEDRPQLSTDGFTPYQAAIRRHFSGSVRPGVLIKKYTDKDTGRYAPPPLVGTERVNINGINNVATICTSHVERCNLTIRTFMKRFTRLALGFSKKVENLAAATAIHVAVYNFCRIHSTIRCTPAMAAGVVDRLWNMDDLFNAVTEHAAKARAKAKREQWIQTLLDRLQRGE
jgi:IS1 family transposase/transposase-like protein